MKDQEHLPDVHVAYSVSQRYVRARRENNHELSQLDPRLTYSMI